MSFILGCLTILVELFQYDTFNMFSCFLYFSGECVWYLVSVAPSEWYPVAADFLTCAAISYSQTGLQEIAVLRCRKDDMVLTVNILVDVERKGVERRYSMWVKLWTSRDIIYINIIYYIYIYIIYYIYSLRWCWEIILINSFHHELVRFCRTFDRGPNGYV